MKILFVDPFGDEESKGLNMGIAYCAASLRKSGSLVSVLDLNNFRKGDSKQRLRQAVERFQPDAVGFSVMSLSYYESINLANNLRYYYKGLIIFGGCEVSAQKNNVFSHTNSVDIIVIGEGEKVLVEIAKVFDRDELSKLSDIKGIIWKKDGMVLVNPPQELEKNLDTLPFPDYDIFGVKEMNHYLLMTSRGCPFSCSFCFSYLGSNWRGRSTNQCIEELKLVINKYKVNVFQICDPCFNVDVERVENFCTALVAEKINLPWYAMGIRADRVKDMMARRMRESGCRRVYLGIESLHEGVFKKIGKGESIDQIKQGIKIFKNNGIEVYGYLVMGLPGDTLKNTIYSYEQAQKLDLDALAYSSAVPYTGTRLEKWVREGNARSIANSLSISSLGTKYNNIAYETDDFSVKERIKARRILNIKAGSYNEPQLPRWFLNFKRICLIIRYDYKNLFRRIKKSIKYRKGFKNSLDKAVLSRYIIFGKVPDGTWGLDKDENFLLSDEIVKINLKALD